MKPGVLTSELWVIVAAVVSAETQVFTSSSQVNYAGVAAAAVYAVCRTALKIWGVPAGPGVGTAATVGRVLEAFAPASKTATSEPDSPAAAPLPAPDPAPDPQPPPA